MRPLGVFSAEFGGREAGGARLRPLQLGQSRRRASLQRLQYVSALHARRLRHRPQVRLGHRAGQASVAAGNLMLDLVQPQNALRRVVGRRNRGVAREAQHLVCSKNQKRIRRWLWIIGRGFLWKTIALPSIGSPVHSCVGTAVARPDDGGAGLQDRTRAWPAAKQCFRIVRLFMTASKLICSLSRLKPSREASSRCKRTAVSRRIQNATSNKNRTDSPRTAPRLWTRS